jgi:hypothetical protein
MRGKSVLRLTRRRRERVARGSRATSPIRSFHASDRITTKKYSRIVEAALKNRQRHFVIDGKAVILGVDGISDFDALPSGKHNEEVQLYAFDMLAVDDASASAFHAQDKSGFWPDGRKEYSSRHSSKARSGRTARSRAADRRQAERRQIADTQLYRSGALLLAAIELAH